MALVVNILLRAFQIYDCQNVNVLFPGKVEEGVNSGWKVESSRWLQDKAVLGMAAILCPV